MNKGISLFSVGFRVFFILAALIAIINPSLWVFSYLGHLTLPLPIVSPLFWHAHEMIFGFSGALIAGFILTASAKWTNTTPYHGKPLIFLVLLWMIERSSYFLPINEGALLVLMNLFFPALSLMMLIKLWNSPKQKYVFMPIILGLTFGKFIHSWGNIYLIDYLEVSGREISTGLIRFIILLIAGRVIPFFTKNRISGVEINLPNWINPISLLPIALLALPWPEAMPRSVLATILIIAIITNISRQLMWKPFATLGVPILFILHIGIAFINIELILELIGIFNDQVHFTQAALHLLMAGGMAVVGVGIMSRVSLGHTGRVIKADLWTCAAYFLIILASIVRVIIPICIPDYFEQSLYFASGTWALGFAIFLLRYFKVLTSARPDRKEY